MKYISGTDYEKFYQLKKHKQIDISGYVDIWKTIILLLLAKSVTNNDKVVSLFSRDNLDELMGAIDDYYDSAFSPEIVNALKVVDSTEVLAKLIAKHVEVDLLAKVKAKIAEFDHWTDKQETKAAIDNLIRDTLWNQLPDCYDEISISNYRQKVYEHVFTRYRDAA